MKKSASKKKRAAKGKATKRSRGITKVALAAARKVASKGAMKPWTNKELDQLKELYKKTQTQELADKFGRSYRSVNGKARQLKLFKSTAYLNGKKAATKKTAEKKSSIKEPTAKKSTSKKPNGKAKDYSDIKVTSRTIGM